MSNERKRILQLVENGTISADEAITLLEALSKQKESTATVTPPESTPQSSVDTPKVNPVFVETPKKESIFEEAPKKDDTSHKKTSFEDIFGRAFADKDINKKMDEFMSDLKQDLSQFSTRMTSLMNSTFSKIKDFDMEFPFGEKVEFEQSYAFSGEEVKGFELEIPNGKIFVAKSLEDMVQVEAHVKTTSNGSEEETITRFTDDFVTLKDGKLSITTDVKLAQVTVRLVIPEKHYDVFVARLLSGSITVDQLDTKLIKAKTLNGTIKLNGGQFIHAELQSSNGAIEVYNAVGEDLEAETMNGRIYIDGALKEVEAESVNGHVVVTTTSSDAHKIKASTVAGSVELYVPKTVALDGQVFSNFGKADVKLADVVLHEEEEQFLLKTVRFNKALKNATLLKVSGESRTGTVLVRYTTN